MGERSSDVPGYIWKYWHDEQGYSRVGQYTNIMMKYFNLEKFFFKVDFSHPEKVPEGAKKLKLNAGEQIERWTDSEECEHTRKHGFAPGPRGGGRSRIQKTFARGSRLLMVTRRK